jgi:hypothetical protein
MTTKTDQDGPTPTTPGAEAATGGVEAGRQDRPAAPPEVEHFARQLGETSASLFMYASIGGMLA